MFFIDQLFMQQDHHEGNLPLVGRHVIERVELETGENLPPTVNQKILEGSYSTKLTIRCNGTRVRVNKIGDHFFMGRAHGKFPIMTVGKAH